MCVGGGLASFVGDEEFDPATQQRTKQGRQAGRQAGTRVRRQAGRQVRRHRYAGTPEAGRQEAGWQGRAEGSCRRGRKETKVQKEGAEARSKKNASVAVIKIKRSSRSARAAMTAKVDGVLFADGGRGLEERRNDKGFTAVVAGTQQRPGPQEQQEQPQQQQQQQWQLQASLCPLERNREDKKI